MEELGIVLIVAIPAVCCSWLLPEKWQLPIVSIISFLFLAIIDYQSCLVLTISSLFTFQVLQKVNKAKVAISITGLALVFIFVFFKIDYDSKSGIFLTSIMPLGMSYYIFRQLHYIIEMYKGALTKHVLKDFLTYMFFFPVFLVGPINRFPEWQRENRRRRWDQDMFSMGLERILYGFVKIVVLGNYLFSFKILSIVQGLGVDSKWLMAYLECLSYAGNSYMQFAGYSDIAIGLSLLMGIRITENFNYPFLARNISDFWNRWHISLSMWCRDYIFLPVASLSRKPWLAIIISMLVLGLWHEISLRYVLWAAFHGVGIVLWQLFNKFVRYELRHPVLNKIEQVLSIIITSNFVILSFVWIKEDSFYDSLLVFKILFGF